MTSLPSLEASLINEEEIGCREDGFQNPSDKPINRRMPFALVRSC